MTMYLAATDLAACKTDDTHINGPVEVGDVFLIHYPETGLVCVSNEAGAIAQAYRPESNRTATHRWVQKTGTFILGTQHTFEPVPRKDRP